MKDEYKLVLASNSPRRKELLAGLDLPFTIRVIGDIDESYPEGLAATDIPLFLSKKKAEAYLSTLADDELLITADTIVWNDNQVLGKPKSENEAFDMLRALSGHTHQVITGVSLTSKRKQVSFSVITDVTFSNLTEAEIHYYLEEFKPYDKAGAYGILTWKSSSLTTRRGLTAYRNGLVTSAWNRSTAASIMSWDYPSNGSIEN